LKQRHRSVLSGAALSEAAGLQAVGLSPAATPAWPAASSGKGQPGFFAWSGYISVPKRPPLAQL